MARTKDHPVRCDDGAAPSDVSQRDFKPSLVPLLIVPPSGDGGGFGRAFFGTGSFVLRHLDGWLDDGGRSHCWKQPRLTQ